MDDQLNVRVTRGLREDVQDLVGESEWFDTEADAVRYAIRNMLQEQRGFGDDG